MNAGLSHGAAAHLVGERVRVFASGFRTSMDGVIVAAGLHYAGVRLDNRQTATFRLDDLELVSALVRLSKLVVPPQVEPTPGVNL